VWCKERAFETSSQICGQHSCVFAEPGRGLHHHSEFGWIHMFEIECILTIRLDGLEFACNLLCIVILDFICLCCRIYYLITFNANASCIHQSFFLILFWIFCCLTLPLPVPSSDDKLWREQRYLQYRSYS
jgi:hypothetical protein